VDNNNQSGDDNNALGESLSHRIIRNTSNVTTTQANIFRRVGGSFERMPVAFDDPD
jgi:hypothetical protein